MPELITGRPTGPGTSAARFIEELRSGRSLDTDSAEVSQTSGTVVAWSSGDWAFQGQTFRAINSYFFLRVPTHTVDISGQEDHERSFLIGHRWWSINIIKTIDEQVFPLHLTALLQLLITDGPRAQPVHLPADPCVIREVCH